MVTTQKITVDIPQISAYAAQKIQQDIQEYVNRIYFHITYSPKDYAKEELFTRVREKKASFSELKGIFSTPNDETDFEKLREEYIREKYEI